MKTDGNSSYKRDSLARTEKRSAFFSSRKSSGIADYTWLCKKNLPPVISPSLQIFGKVG
jgi:hypothetical protein